MATTLVSYDDDNSSISTTTFEISSSSVWGIQQERLVQPFSQSPSSPGVQVLLVHARLA